MPYACLTQKFGSPSPRQLQAAPWKKERSLRECPFVRCRRSCAIQSAAVFEDAGMTGVKALGTLTCKTTEGRLWFCLTCSHAHCAIHCWWKAEWRCGHKPPHFTSKPARLSIEGGRCGWRSLKFCMLLWSKLAFRTLAQLMQFPLS